MFQITAVYSSWSNDIPEYWDSLKQPLKSLAVACEPVVSILSLGFESVLIESDSMIGG
jgi:hypothetical protein